MKLCEFNEMSRKVLDSYYATRSADDFFKIDSMLETCRKYKLTPLEVPTLIEMQNVIVMG